MNVRLLAIGTLLRAREAWNRSSAWLLEPAERREHDRWQQERHAATLAELSPNAAAIADRAYRFRGQAAGIAVAGLAETFKTPVEPWHGKASGCA